MENVPVLEWIGLVAAIAGLVFVGLEIRQNNRLAQAAAYQEIGFATAQNWHTVSQDPEFRCEIAKLSDPSGERKGRYRHRQTSKLPIGSVPTGPECQDLVQSMLGDLPTPCTKENLPRCR